jgi:hypothetical protein
VKHSCLEADGSRLLAVSGTLKACADKSHIPAL